MSQLILSSPFHFPNCVTFPPTTRRPASNSNLQVDSLLREAAEKGEELA